MLHRMRLKLPNASFGAYLFDCDGTIADSMPLHYVAWRNALAECNCEFAEEVFYAWGGMPTAEIVSKLNEKFSLKMRVNDVCARKEELYFEMLPRLTAVPEVLEHIEGSYGRIPLAVVSGSTRESVTRSLRALGLINRFTKLVCAGEYPRSKPHPDAFLVAAQRLGIRAEAWLVFEDSDVGIKAATAARMTSVKVPPPWERISRAPEDR